jgi:hypothetical protein
MEGQKKAMERMPESIYLLFELGSNANPEAKYCHYNYNENGNRQTLSGSSLFVLG